MLSGKTSSTERAEEYRAIEEAIAREARKLMAGERGSHGWDHVERVRGLCRHIGTEEGADLFVLELAACLHDIGRRAEHEAQGAACHARIGAAAAREILTRQGLPETIVAQVTHCIAAHRFRDESAPPQSLEAKVLFDADKLDSLGAVGVGRAFLFAGEVGARLHNPEADIAATQAYSSEDTAYREFTVKLKYIKDRMQTATGRRLARDRHGFMEEFFRRLNSEVIGEE